MKSSQVRALLLLSVAAVAGCQARVPFQRSIHVGSTKAPVIGLIFVPADYLALQPKLESLFGGPVLFDPALGAEDIAQHLEQGDWQFGIFSAGEYAGIADKPGLAPVAMAMGEHGQTTMKAFIVAARNSSVKSMADCKGKRFAFGPAGDLLYDHAARESLTSAGVPASELTREVLPPHLVSGRLNLSSGMEIAKVVAFDVTVPAGVVDEVTFAALPETGGSLIAGPSKDQFTLIGGTQSVPGPIVVASTKASPEDVEKLRSFLTLNVANDPMICKQMKVKGFVDPDLNAYAAAARLIQN